MGKRSSVLWLVYDMTRPRVFGWLAKRLIRSVLFSVGYCYYTWLITFLPFLLNTHLLFFFFLVLQLH